MTPEFRNKVKAVIDNSQSDQDIDYFCSELTNTFSWFVDLTDDRKAALIALCGFGWKHLLGLEPLLASLSRGNYLDAAAEILKLGAKTATIASIIEKGSL